MTEVKTSIETSPRVEVNNAESLLKRIRSRRRKLQKVARELKASFVGLDEIIDEIIRNIEVWYVMPEVITRPVIVNLWGMTGVGKTDLVRRLVRGLELNDKFLEIQLCNKGSATGSQYHGSLSGQLGCSNLESKQPGILLLDEIQRFRTIDEQGKEIQDYKFQDVWMMLSDGKFSGSTDKEDIMQVMFEHVYWSIPSEKKENEEEKEDTEADKKRKYRQSYYSAKFLRKALRLQEPIEEIMQWDNEKKIQIAIERMEDQSTYEGDDYSKVLVFISGNLDEAYRMSEDCSDTNHDADVLHAFSKKINIITIKNALMKRFKPEQISRFGNTHIIYPSLSQKSYENIIRRRIDSTLEAVREQHGITVTADQSVYDFVYRNGVYPAQGVRPLFSTISSYIENSMPAIVLAAIENAVTKVAVSYKNRKLVAVGDNFSVSVKCEGVIDTIKSENDFEKKVMVSVHEAAHAVSYGVLFGIAPTQIVSNSSSQDSGGFVGIHQFNHSKKTVLDLATTYMAGAAAEELVFGVEALTAGPQGDIAQVTSLIAQAYRDWGLFGYTTRVEAPGWPSGKYSNNNNSREINDCIERTVAEQRAAARELLNKYVPLLKDVADVLIAEGKVEPEHFKAMCLTHGVEVKITDPKHTVYERDSYSERYEKFFLTHQS